MIDIDARIIQHVEKAIAKHPRLCDSLSCRNVLVNNAMFEAVQVKNDDDEKNGKVTFESLVDEEMLEAIVCEQTGLIDKAIDEYFDVIALIVRRILYLEKQADT